VGKQNKVFSANELGDSELHDLFGEDNLLWVYRKVWQAYPGKFCYTFVSPVAVGWESPPP
jgi:hypothetical protein